MPDHAEPNGEPAETPVERTDRRPIVIALAITVTFLIVEIIGALLTNSLALLADAAHMVTDVGALLLTLFAIWLARRPATAERSFGFLRAEILAALVNAATLIAISIYVFWEAIQRLGEPEAVKSGPMLVVAIVGMLANGVAAWVLMRGGGHGDNLNLRGALLHVVGDLLGSAAAIVAAVVMLLTGWYLADPLLSIAIGGLILWSSWRLLGESVNVLLESAPRQIDMTALRSAMLATPGVVGVHDLHVWTVTSGLVALSGHIEVTDDQRWPTTLDTLSTLLRDRFAIHHATLQPEEPHPQPNSFRGCSLDSPAGRAACRVSSRRPAIAEPGHRH